MSFLGTAECSTAGNPLSQFTKHAQNDKSLQRDKFVGQGQQGLQESFRSQRNITPQDEALNTFLQQNGQIPQEPIQPFNMEEMRRDLEGYTTTSPPTLQGRVTKSNLVQQMQMEAINRVSKVSDSALARHTSTKPHQFLQTEPMAMSFQGPMGHPGPMAMGFQGQMAMGFPGPMAMGYQGPTVMGFPGPIAMGFQGPMAMGHQGQMVMGLPGPMSMGYQEPVGMGYGMNTGTIQHPHTQMPIQSQLEAMNSPQAKGRMIELDDEDWDKEFAKIDQAAQLDQDAEANNAIETELNDMDRFVLSQTNGLGDLEGISPSVQAESATTSGLQDYGLLGVNETELRTLEGFDWGGLNTFDEGFQDPQPNYLFEQENPFNAAHSPYDEGLKIMREGGNLSLAALAFEAAVQQDPQHNEAWSMLGHAQAQNEKETPAIRAYEQALRIDPSSLSALMGLAISYTNENYDTTAYRTLERWLSVKYPQIVSPQSLTPDSDIGFSDRQVLHKRVTDHFIRAAQLSPKGDHMDPDVQVGLGVLFYGVEEHEKAVDCFAAALASHESGTSNHPDQLHLLWNRLGATLANSGRSEEAIDAYAKALALNPNFVRARFNLGVSCINLGFSEQAAQHLLSALSMHRVVEREGIARVKEVIRGDENGVEGQSLGDDEVERLVAMNQSTNLLETLRRVFGSMGRKDLAERVQVGMNVDSFRGEFDF